MTTAVVILNWNGEAYLKKFLPKVIEFSAHQAEIVVADNNSEDNSIAYLKENHPDVTIIENAENGGFAKGYNDALKHVNADLYVLLNSDIEVTENWLVPLISFMEMHPETAACQPKIKSYSQKEYFEYAGAAGGFIDKFGYPFCRGRIFDTIEKDQQQYNDYREIFWATGACMMIRSDVFHETGGLDDDFFAHMEEIDLCWRCKNLGYKIHFIPYSIVYHVGGGTLPKNNPFKTYLNFRNNLILLFKNQSKPMFRANFPARVFLDFLAGLKFLFSGQHKDSIAILRAYRHFQKGKSRHAAKKTFAKDGINGIFKKSIIKEYYINRKKKFTDLQSKDFYTN